MHSAIAVGLETFLLPLTDFFCQFGILFRLTYSTNKIIITAS